jgi:hypothetical protein
MAKPKIVLKEWIEEGKLTSYMINPPLRQYDPHKLRRAELKDGWTLFDGTETLNPLTYLQFVIGGQADGIYRVSEMAYDTWYDVFRDGLEKIESGGNKPKPFIVGFVITGESLYKRVSELASNCFKERRK